MNLNNINQEELVYLKQREEADKKLKELFEDPYLPWDCSHQSIPEIINTKNYKIGVEIGCAYGGHLDSILSKTKIEKLYGVDPYLQYKEYEGDLMNKEQNKMDTLFGLVKNRLSIYKNRIEIIRKKSEEAYHLFQDESLDFAYIDGNHFEEYIKNDLNFWWPKIKKGGMLSGHDYDHPGFPYVTICVNNFFKNLNIEVIDLKNHNWCAFKL